MSEEGLDKLLKECTISTNTYKIKGKYKHG